MTTFLLVRHGSVDSVGKWIAGWTAGVHLSPAGRAQAEALAERLASAPVAAVYSSPLERAVETAEPIARRHGLDVIVSEAFGEVHYGEWTGRSLDDLRADPLFTRFNLSRSSTHPPGGESALEVQTRAVSAIERLRRAHGDTTVAVVSHADVIRPLLASYVGIPLDFILRFEVAPASVSVLDVGDHDPCLVRLNWTEGDPFA